MYQVRASPHKGARLCGRKVGSVKKFLLIICILWIGFIFYNSSRPGNISHKNSFAIVNFFRSEKVKIEYSNTHDIKQNKSDKVKQDAYNKLPITKHDNLLNYVVRKNAHAFEYLILSILVSGTLFLHNKTGKDAMVYIMFICLLCAVLDEFNQKFSISRTSSVEDVLIDFGGSLIGIVIFYIVYYVKHNEKKHKEPLQK